MTFIQRTTITLPADLLEAAKVAAFHRRMSVSELVRTSLEQNMYSRFDKPAKESKKTPLMQFVGRRSLGIKSFKREDIYDDYLRKKMSA